MPRLSGAMTVKCSARMGPMVCQVSWGRSVEALYLLWMSAAWCVVHQRILSNARTECCG